MLRSSNLRITVDSISLNSMSLMRSKKVIVGIPLTIDMLTSPSCKTRSHSFLIGYPSG
ncbi:hypothetical protein F383_32681 [Gossypium arboreum]|uniref:Uncharacterized protein n=1 Tax=Gossypium arboreum TaxID=29729 RepID=A0A0B0N3E9_GOSAR|nr:hypothetical protein F383_32681 [Gossypium arboreum]